MKNSLVKLLGAGALLAALNAGPSMADGDFGMWDADDDGVLTEEEFNEGWGETGVFSDFDVDGDGLLTEEEYDEALSGIYGEDDDSDLDDGDGEALEPEDDEEGDEDFGKR